MKAFLYRIAEKYYKEYGSDIKKLVFVFPNRRAGLFFQKHLASLSKQPLFSPFIFTISDFITDLSGLLPADKIRMLFMLYDIYTKRSGSEESFDEFLYWGDILLSDFDDVDKYLVNAKSLFTNVTDLHEIDRDFEFLSVNQVAAIRSFWTSFNPEKKKKNEDSFVAIWEILFDIYTEFKSQLKANSLGYEGMIFREVAEKCEQTIQQDMTYEKVIFVGLNALTEAERKILLSLKKGGVAEFYWDYESEWVRDPENKASYFVKRNIHDFPSAEIVTTGHPIPEITVIGVPSNVGQAKQIYPILDNLIVSKELTDDNAIQTAIVLPDEQLLLPILNHIPEPIDTINVTMGYPLSSTPVAILIENITSLQRNIRYVDTQAYFYFKDVLAILRHPYVIESDMDIISSLSKEITGNNKIYISPVELAKTNLLTLIFEVVEDAANLSAYLIHILKELNALLSGVDDDNIENDDENIPITMDNMEREFIYQYYTAVNRMNDMLEEVSIRMTHETYFRLLKRITGLISIPFQGEPLSGLQVMGVLETRTLDFDNLIILSANEGVFPAKDAATTFIPFNLRKAFGLPLPELQDSVSSYHFYRLLYRAKRVWLIYDTRTSGLKTGEASRFIHQLNYHYELPLKQKVVVYNIVSSPPPVISVEKKEEVKALLATFKKGGNRSLSASAINKYLNCPLQFYYGTVKRIEESDDVSESIEGGMFGSIIHKVMEELYQPLNKKLITADLLQLIAKNEKLLTEKIEIAFAEEFFKTKKRRKLTGQHFIIGETIRKYVKRILTYDRSLTPFQYIESERNIQGELDLTDGSVINLKGFIDRIDEVKGALRVVDYKSGIGKSDFSSIQHLFDKELKDRRGEIMQVFMYCWMLAKEEKSGQQIQPAIYYLRSLFKDFSPLITYKEGRGKKEDVIDFSVFIEEFEQELRFCMDEIFNPHIPFTQTDNPQRCTYCLFAEICGRK